MLQIIGPSDPLAAGGLDLRTTDSLISERHSSRIQEDHPAIIQIIVGADNLEGSVT